MSNSAPTLAVIGGGPAGLMAADMAASRSIEVDLYDAMPSIGRKFLLTGKGGLNITHSEPFERFIERYDPLAPQLYAALTAFDPNAVRHWVESFGIDTFVGSSGRVFPSDLKAAPLLRAWQRRLRDHAVRFHTRHRWQGLGPDGALRFATPDGIRSIQADAVVLALGGASWSRLGSDGHWVMPLSQAGILINPLAPSNCRFECSSFSPEFCQRHAGQAVKTIRLQCWDRAGITRCRAGEIVITATGIEGGPVYALSSCLRKRIEAEGSVRVEIDLSPHRSLDRLVTALNEPRGSRSFSGYMKRKTGIEGIKLALLRECLTPDELTDPVRLAQGIKSLPLCLTATGPLDTAISTAGGIRFDELDPRLMMKKLPGVFAAGEMLDYDAPTGGYLLTACLATGRLAGLGAVEWLLQREHRTQTQTSS